MLYSSGILFWRKRGNNTQNLRFGSSKTNVLFKPVVRILVGVTGWIRVYALKAKKQTVNRYCI